MTQDKSNTSGHKAREIDASRRRLAKAALAAPVLMSIPGRQVFAGTCTFSGDLSGNVSGAAGNCVAGNQVNGPGPAFWVSNAGVMNPAGVTFQDVFFSSRFGSLTLQQVLELGDSATCLGGGVPPFDTYCATVSAQARQLAQYAVAAFLNAYESENGGSIVPPGYYFSTSQVIGLYLTVENGPGDFEVNPGQWLALDQLAVIDLYAQTFV